MLVILFPVRVTLDVLRPADGYPTFAAAFETPLLACPRPMPSTYATGAFHLVALNLSSMLHKICETAGLAVTRRIMRASVRDLRLHAGELLAAVERGESVEITFRGRPCAKLVGVAALELAANPAFGMWADGDDMDVEATIDRLRASRATFPIE